MKVKMKNSYVRAVALCVLFCVNCFVYAEDPNSLKVYDCVIVQKLGFNTPKGYGFLKVSHHDTLCYVVTTDSARYEGLSVDSTYRFFVRQKNKTGTSIFGYGTKDDLSPVERAMVSSVDTRRLKDSPVESVERAMVSSVNLRYIDLGEKRRVSSTQIASHNLYELLVMESPNVKSREFRLPQGMNVEPSMYETMEDKALDYFYRYVSEFEEYSERYIAKEMKKMTKKMTQRQRISTFIYKAHIMTYCSKESGKILKTPLNDVYMNVYIWKYNNNLIDSVAVNDRLTYKPTYEKVDLKFKSPHKGKGKRIISICANCHYNNMNHVEVTISKKKELQTYIIVMREDGSLFDIVKKEDRILILNYCIEI